MKTCRIKRNHSVTARRLLVVPCTFAALLLVATNGHTAPNHFGMNVCPAADYDGMRAFADAMKMHRQWQEEPHIPIPVDENGWPLQDGGTCVFHNAPANGGTYGLYFTTQNPAVDARDVQVRDIWGSAQITNMRYDAATNTVAYDFVPGSASQLKIGFANTNGGVKNVKLMRPTSEGATTYFDTSVTFTDFAKEALRKCRLIRFHAWCFTENTNMVAEWADRTLPSYSTQPNRKFQGGPTGVAWEYMIQLSNEAQVDMYINIPFLATDDYVRQLATLLKNSLDPQRVVYIEYGNELWNFGGPWDAHRNHDAAVAEVAAGNSPLAYDGNTHEWTVTKRRVAKRGAEISVIFREVFGDSDMMTRVRPLLCIQMNDGQAFFSTGLDFLFDYYNNPDYVSDPHPPNYFFYGAGPSLYYRPDPQAGIDDIWHSGFFNSTTYGQDMLEKDAGLAASFGLKYCAYEGGPEMSMGTTRFSAWDDPRMTELLVRHHNTFCSYGGDLFAFTELIYWGSTDDVAYAFIHNIEQTNTAKMRALDSLASVERAPITFGEPVPVSFDGKAFTSSEDGWPTGTGSERLPAGKWFAYVIRAEEYGTYGVTVETSTGTSTLEVYLDGTLIGSAAVSGAQTTPKLTGDLAPGLHGVLIRSTDAEIRIEHVNVTLEQILPVDGTARVHAVKPGRMIARLASGELRVSVSAEHPADMTVRLCSMQGREVAARTVRVAAGPNRIALPVGNLSTGAYLVRVGRQTKPLLITR
ncbi:MAG: hypothetical protein GF331_14995 [Chitinivibrionales bacterium]|nr:hypothetical protein [Chitinivibrionales bacterium]